MKTKKLQLISLTAVCAVCVGGAVISAVNPFSASAAVTTTATSIFTSTGSATQSSTGDYLQFKFKGESNSKVEYRKPLAYKWYWDKEKALETWEDTSSFTDVYEDGVNFFSAEFAFTGDMNFSTFTVTFNSSENSKTKDELTTNEVVFFNHDGQYSVAVRNNDDKDVENEELEKGAVTIDSLSADDVIKIALSKKNTQSGEYAVVITIGETEIDGTFNNFTNIAGAYADYSAPNATLIFSAEVSSDTTKEQAVNMISLNGQSFEMEENSTTITKFAPTVLAVNEEIKEFTLGTPLRDFSYLAINVCNSTASNSKITNTVTYYQYDPEDTEPNWATLTSSTVLFDKATFAEEGEDGKRYEYVAIKFEVSVSGEDEKYTYYLSDYAEEGYTAKQTLTAPEAEEGSESAEAVEMTFLKAGLDNNAPYYITENFDENVAAYQKAIDSTLDDLSAGDGYYFYLPSLENLIDDEETAYSGLKFTIYYRNATSDSTSTSSNLAYNKLQIPTANAGNYEFRVIATDKNGNAMKFKDNKDTNNIPQTITSSNVWDFDEDKIPTFTFTVQNKTMEIDEVETLTSAYINANYTIEKLEVKGNERDRSYDLYYLNGLGAAGGISYSELIEFANYLIDEDITVKEDAFVKELIEWYNAEKGGNLEYKAEEQYLDTIPHWDSDGPLNDEDDDWTTSGNYYEWKDTSLSFTPRAAGYYILRIKLADSERIGETKYAYQIVSVQAESDVIFGETYWIENNIVTVVFIVIAAVCLIGIVALLVVKPSEETVESSSKKKGKGSSGKLSERKKKDK